VVGNLVKLNDFRVKLGRVFVVGEEDSPFKVAETHVGLHLCQVLGVTFSHPLLHERTPFGSVHGFDFKQCQFTIGHLNLAVEVPTYVAPVFLYGELPVCLGVTVKDGDPRLLEIRDDEVFERVAQRKYSLRLRGRLIVWEAAQREG
jgi:hypothetical protein